MTVNANLSFLLLLSCLLLECLTFACNIDAARQPSGAAGGSWSGVAVDDSSVVQLKQTVASDAIVAKAHHVIESYQQVNASTKQTVHIPKTRKEKNKIIK